MKQIGIYMIGFAVLLLATSMSFAGDFDWMKDFNIRAEADSSGLRARLEARFKVGDVNIRAVLGNTDSPADAYMLLRLGEISEQPLEEVIGKYKAGKGKGWGNLAKSLGIKPGSREFHALKQGQDLYEGGNETKEKSKGKGHGRKGKK